MSSIFHLEGILVLLLLAICTAYHTKAFFPSWFTPTGGSNWRATLWKFARVGERLSPWIAVALVIMGVRHFFF
jgi:hypothetical protein